MIVTQKNFNISDSLNFLASYLTAITKENGQGWWIIQPLSLKSEIAIFSLGDSGLELSSIHRIPLTFSINSEASGSAKFSPNGNHLAIFNPYDELLLMDFDRNTGLLSNPQQLSLTNTPSSMISGGSTEWSSHSRFLYVCAFEDLWQVDTWENDLADGVIHIDSYNGTQNPFTTRFFRMALAPDCRIYMNSFNGSYSYHVINKPNEKGKDCDFVQQGVQLPYASSNGTLPNFPRYRVDEEDKCDPTITSIFGEDIFWRRDLVAYPNPVVDQLNVELPDGEKGRLYVFDSAGQLLWQSKETYLGSEVQLDMSGYATGTYSVEFVPEENKERRLWTSWVVKVD